MSSTLIESFQYADLGCLPQGSTVLHGLDCCSLVANDDAQMEQATGVEYNLNTPPGSARFRINSSCVVSRSNSLG